LGKVIVKALGNRALYSPYTHLQTFIFSMYPYGKYLFSKKAKSARDIEAKFPTFWHWLGLIPLKQSRKMENVKQKKELE
jgi:hypothetical protein